MDAIEFDPDYLPTKTFTQLLAEGIPHAGGLAQLAALEQEPDGPPQTAALRASYREIMTREKRET